MNHQNIIQNRVILQISEDRRRREPAFRYSPLPGRLGMCTASAITLHW
ncbi:hypothetical protein [Oceanispirochaeta sp.]|nr:hypothetical protein [Oceanispirochaeta sp.]MDA3955340.1 hypothetical protein [Oceanispirochaeta sp.]